MRVCGQLAISDPLHPIRHSRYEMRGYVGGRSRGCVIGGRSRGYVIGGRSRGYVIGGRSRGHLCDAPIGAGVHHLFLLRHRCIAHTVQQQSTEKAAVVVSHGRWWCSGGWRYARRGCVRISGERGRGCHTVQQQPTEKAAVKVCLT